MKKFIEKKGVIRNENNTSITIAKKKGTNGFIKSHASNFVSPSSMPPPK